MKNKKGKESMSWIMTYGWAVLVVLACIGALAYFDVLSPANLLPQKCDFNGDFGCIEIAKTNFNEQTISFKLVNGYPFTIDLTNAYGEIKSPEGLNCNLEKIIVFDELDNNCDCDCIEKDENITKNILWLSGEVVVFKFKECNLDEPDLRYRGYPKIFVTDYEGEQMIISGIITGKIK